MHQLRHTMLQVNHLERDSLSRLSANFVTH